MENYGYAFFLAGTMAAEVYNSVNLFGTMAAERHNSVNLFGTIAKELHSSLDLFGTLYKAKELQQRDDSSSSELTSTRTAIQHRTAAFFFYRELYTVPSHFDECNLENF